MPCSGTGLLITLTVCVYIWGARGSAGYSDYGYEESYSYIDELQCYQCIYIVGAHDASTGEASCLSPSPGDSVQVVTCSGNNQYCMEHLDYNSDDSFKIYRGCTSKCKAATYHEEKHGYNGHMKCCSDHLCNGAVSSAPWRLGRAVTTVYGYVLCVLVWRGVVVMCTGGGLML